MGPLLSKPPNEGLKGNGTINLRPPGNAGPRILGLHQVYPDPSGSIVAIHGLDTHSPKTWVAWRKDGDPASGTVHWLQDRNMLPSIIPNARIFTYDWNANFDKDAAAQGLLGHADSLLEKLHIRRSKDGHHRPLIFLASCFGGILLCRALHRASESHSEYQHILRSTVGVAFLGTPFQGSDEGFVTATQLRLNVAISLGGETADELIKYLKNDGERKQLDDVVQQFCEMANSDIFKFPIRCFYETRRTDFKKVLKKLTPEFREALGKHDTGILVPEYSACLQGRPRSALAVRHGMLNKFPGPEDQAFQSVSYYLTDFAENALQIGVLAGEPQTSMNSLEACDTEANTSKRTPMVTPAPEELTNMHPSMPNTGIGYTFSSHDTSRQYNAPGGTQNISSGNGNQFPGANFSGAVTIGTPPQPQNLVPKPSKE